MKYSATATNRKITWFSREEEAGTLDLSPAFQRRPVWTVEQASYLVDTILHGLPFPEVYIRSETTAEGRTTFQVVDGQQRIRSILEFSRSDFALSGDGISPRWLGKSFAELGDDEKRAFWNYDVVTRDLFEASDGDIRDLFRRLNISAVTLNDQELRHAKYTGPFIKLMEEIADDDWWSDMRIVSVRQIRRMEDVEFISELFVGMMAGPQHKKQTLDQYYEDFNTDFPDAAKWRRHFDQTRDLLAMLLQGSDLRQWSGKSDFYTLFLATAGFVGKRFSKAQREQVAKVLMRFRRDVDQAKKKNNTQKFADRVHRYADAVTRAATDADRRVTRDEIVAGLIREGRQKAT